MSDVPILKPISITEYEFKQSTYEHVPKLPFRSIIVASSTGGKTVLVQNLILNVYRNSFARIFIFSSAFIMTQPLQKLKNVSGMNCTWMMKKNKFILIIIIQVI